MTRAIQRKTRRKPEQPVRYNREFLRNRSLKAIVVFAQAGPDTFANAAKHASLMLALVLSESGNIGMGVNEIAEQTQEEQLQIQSELLESIRRVADGGGDITWSLPPRWRDGKLQVDDLSVIRTADGESFFHVDGPWPTNFWFAVGTVIGARGHQLGRCKREACGQLFVRMRADSEYCSTRCGGAERAKRYYYRNHESMKDKKHDTYKARRRRVQPKARITRRRRRGRSMA